MIIKLSTPLSFKDSSVDELDLSLEKLTGRDLLDVEAGFKARGIQTGAWDMSRAFCIALAAKSFNMPQEVLGNLPLKDFSRIVNEVITFLAETVSAD
ncbi:MAG: phage tail assembly protein [Synergistaceae bacterium]|nr:phage tail assembly protein [Synergistaceae bacterium]